MAITLETYSNPAAQFAVEATDSLRQILLEQTTIVVADSSAVSWRVKSPAAIRAKLRSRHVNDFVGIRVLTIHPASLPLALEQVRKWARSFSLKELAVQDKYNQPGVGGYRAFHIDFEMEPGNRWRLPVEVTTEIQLTTWLQGLHAAVLHRILYKAEKIPDKTLVRELANFAESISQADISLGSKIEVILAAFANRFEPPSNISS
jgi:ppGpp synthetase/RelA/SpoT-type nucleotidyltranferase